MKHIGIVGCSPPGAALCYETICVEGAAMIGREHAHPEISLHTNPFDKYMEFIYADDWEGVAGLMIDSAEKLARTGAQFCISPDNTIHQAFDLVLEKSPLPWLHIAEVVAAKAKENGYKKLAVLGTKYLMEGPVYKEKLGEAAIGNVIPELDERLEINRIIFEELVYGKFIPGSIEHFQKVIERLMKDENADAVILGCTEIPLIINENNSPLPTLPSTQLLSYAALEYALE
ncbi:MAG: amino acid racemase [Acidobacteria bacterium]|nr:amino acid racemase [Acidobacteriota bacterium]